RHPGGAPARVRVGRRRDRRRNVRALRGTQRARAGGARLRGGRGTVFGCGRRGRERARARAGDPRGERRPAGERSPPRAPRGAGNHAPNGEGRGPRGRPRVEVGRALGRGARTIRPHAVKRFVMRGIAGPFERSWSGEPGTLPWTKLFLPLSLGYRAGSGLARRRAAGRRRTLEDCHVIAVGNVTVGGVGKSSLARWLALEAVGAGVRSGILLRGHGAGGASREGGVVPDFAGYPL